MQSRKYFALPLLAWGLLGLPLAANATESLSLQSLINLATQNSPLLQKAEAERNEGQWKHAEGIAILLPTLTLSANHFFDKKYQILDVSLNGGPTVSIPQIFPSTSGTLSARWLIFDGLANINLYRSASKIRKALESQYQWVRFQLEQDITLSYLKLQAAKKLEDVAKSNLKTLENHQSQVNSLKAGGVATHYDVLKVESQLSEAQAELLQAKDNIEMAQERLSALIGSKQDFEVIDAPLPSPLGETVEQVKSLQFTHELNGRQDLQAAEYQVEASDALDSASTFFWVPKISLGADYTKYNNLSDTLSDWDRYRTAWNVGVFMNWTLFSPREFSQAKQNQYKAESAQKAAQNLLLQAPVDFAFWKKRFLYSASLYGAKTADLARATETVRLAEAGFKAGIRTTTEVLDAELELFRARAGIVNAQMNCIEAKIKLELSIGAKL